MPKLTRLFDFSTPDAVSNEQLPSVGRELPAVREQSSQQSFGEEPELPPTWSEHSETFHTTKKCTRLQAIRRNRRVTGNPGLRAHCLNCIDIISTKRGG